jgi:hypothetical protein
VITWPEYLKIDQYETNQAENEYQATKAIYPNALPPPRIKLLTVDRMISVAKNIEIR